MGRSVLVALVTVLVPAACVTRKPCRPGTILLTLQLGEVPQVDLQVHGGGWDSPSGTIRRQPGASSVVVEIHLPTYRITDQIDIVVTPPDAAPISQQVTLAPECTAAALEVKVSDAGSSGGTADAAVEVPDATTPPGDDAMARPGDASPDAGG